MFCAQCGTQNPDGSRFCANCGAVFEEQPIVEESVIQETKAEEPVVEEAVIQEIKADDSAIPETIAASPAAPEPVAQAPVQEPAYQQPQQPVYQQPVYQQPQQPPYQQPMYQQPAYGQPYVQQPRVRTPMDPKKKKVIAITSVCGVILAAFLIVLFTAIIPNSGFKGKLRHAWKREGWFSTTVVDLKHKTWSTGSESITISKWKVDGNYLTITTTSTGFASNVQSFVFAMTPDGSTLILFDAEGYEPGDSPDYIYVRAD